MGFKNMATQVMTYCCPVKMNLLHELLIK